ncbi:hypothetical protein BCV70DRAFT_200570 [Testicularia cyperi]|uniref:Uncharacterized protein n=1 Tax=Testicularia cyperi TaxID=1882483 RepID=A0A317XP66_9BASI|nr:hypothetical protein BCV70DRAFT_200570 [Testicularia cyperi]
MSGLPDLSHGTSWNDSTFSFDSLNASTNPADQGGPKTPPPTSSNQDLRLNLQPDSNLHLNLHAEKMASSHQAANNNTNLWIPNASQSSTTSSHHH